MLIKVQHNPGNSGLDHVNFILFDNVSNVEYGNTAKLFVSLDDFQDWLETSHNPGEEIRWYIDDRFNPCIPRTPKWNNPLGIDGSAYMVNFIKFTRGEESYRIFFDDQVFICSDTGKTLEIARAGGFFVDPNKEAKHSA